MTVFNWLRAQVMKSRKDDAMLAYMKKHRT